ncbi:MAG: DNA methyltransferase, partial [Myxococcota bacterium]|nr:DNA methyltransferase [Myxococcota bacterium]
MTRATIHVGDCREVLRSLPAASVHCVVTSPPYWGLRDYGVAGQLGLEATPEEYVARMVEVFREVRRVL